MRPLYQYRTSQLEFKELQRLVIDFLPHTNLSNHNHQEWCACFSLWAAEFYRRSYEGQDGFSYNEFWKELGFSIENPRDAIRIGLSIFWKRELATQEKGVAYLGSVFREGGLPIKLVSEGTGRFSEALKQVLKLYYKVELGAETIQSLIIASLWALPQSFKNEDSINLIAACTKHLYGLAETLEEHSNNQHPVEYLNNHFPTWREEFPLLLDFEAADDLVQNWLTSAKQGVKETKRIKSRLRCKHFMQISPFTIRTEITIPDVLHPEFNQPDTSSLRVAVALQEQGQTLHQFAPGYVSFGDKIKVKTRASQKTFTRNNPCSQLYINLSSAGTSLDNIPLINSALDFSSAPVVFVKSGSGYKFVGQNTVLTQHEEVYVVAHEKFEIINTLADVQEQKVLESEFGLLKLYKVIGDVRFTLTDSKYRVATSHKGVTTGLLTIKGREFPYPSKPSSVFLGAPKVVDSEGLLAEQIGLKVSVVATDENSYGYGVNKIIVTNQEGDILLKRKVAILPEDLNFRFSESEHNAIISFDSHHNMISSMVAEDCNVTRENIVNGKCFYIKTDKPTPPSKCLLSLQPDLLAQPIVIELPFPKSGFSGYLPNGSALPDVITLDSLLGSELNLYSMKASSEFVIEFRLNASNDVTSEYKIPVSDKPLKLGLANFTDEISYLLSFSEQLDAFIDISIHHEAQAKRLTRVKRYEAYIQTVEQGGVALIGADGVSDQWLDTDCELYVMQPNVPERKAVKLEHRAQGGIDLHCYDIPDYFKTHGGLIVPSPEGRSSFRPTFVPGEAEHNFSDTPKSLQQSSLVYHPKFNPNVFKGVLDDMSKDYLHPSWGYLRDLYDNYGYLPLSTFMIWSELVKHDRALAMAMFKFEFNELFINRLKLELPKLWEMSRFSDWNSALCTYTEVLNNKLTNDALRERVLSKAISNISRLKGLLPESFISELQGMKQQKPPVAVALTIMGTHCYSQLVKDAEDYYSHFKVYPAIEDYVLQSWASEIQIYPKIFELLKDVPLNLLPIYCYPIICALETNSGLKESSTIDVWSGKQLRTASTEWFETVYGIFFHINFEGL